MLVGSSQHVGFLPRHHNRRIGNRQDLDWPLGTCEITDWGIEAAATTDW